MSERPNREGSCVFNHLLLTTSNLAVLDRFWQINLGQEIVKNIENVNRNIVSYLSKEGKLGEVAEIISGSTKDPNNSNILPKEARKIERL